MRCGRSTYTIPLGAVGIGFAALSISLRAKHSDERANDGKCTMCSHHISISRDVHERLLVVAVLLDMALWRWAGVLSASALAPLFARLAYAAVQRVLASHAGAKSL